jgi:hypothetical protein
MKAINLFLAGVWVTLAAWAVGAGYQPPTTVYAMMCVMIGLLSIERAYRA